MQHLFILLLIISICGCGPTPSGTSPKADENIVQINGYYGTYEAQTKLYGEPANSLQLRKNEQWPLHPPAEQTPEHRIGVLFPNREQNDSYWAAVHRGITTQAKEHHFAIDFLASDGYANLEQHREQFVELAQKEPDAIIIGAIHYRAMDDLIAKASTGGFGKPIPVIGVVNDLNAPTVSGKVMVSFTDMGRKAGEYVLDHACKQGKEVIHIAFLPGPINSGWAPESLYGFVQAIRPYPKGIQLIEPAWGTPTPEVQKQALMEILSTRNQVDYIIGNAVAAAEAVKLVQSMGREEDIQIVSTYYNPTIIPLLNSGKIAAAPSDQPQMIGRISVGMAAAILKGKTTGQDLPFRIAPEIKIIRHDEPANTHL